MPTFHRRCLRFRSSACAAGMVIDPLAGLLTWTPPANSPGDVLSITVRVMDSAGGSDEQSFDVVVIPQPLTQGIQVINGDLIINGTAGDDQVAIQGTGIPGQFQIFSTLGRATVNGVTGDIRVELGDGADQLGMGLIYVAGGIEIDSGSGDDLVALGQHLVVSTARDINVDLGEGDDGLIGSLLYIAGSQHFEGGAGNDHIALTGFADLVFVIGTSSAGAAKVIGGIGDDVIDISYSFIIGSWTIDAGAGNDSVRLRTSAAIAETGIAGGDENDHLAIDACYFVGGLSMNGGTGSDRIELRNSIGLSHANMLGSDGHDLVDVTNVMVNSLRVEGAAGNDTVVMRASLLAQLFADLGDHDDALMLENNIVHGTAELHGGLGMGDWLTDRGNLLRGAIRKRTFEMFAR